MKKLLKTLVCLTAAATLLLSTTAFAATTNTVTKYTDEGATVTSTVGGLTEGSMVTYLAVKGDDQAVSANGDNIVYIGQETVGSTKSATFSYKLNEVPAEGTYATVKYGSNVDAIADTNKVTFGSVEVIWNGVAGTVTGNTIVGSGDATTLTIAAAANSEIININVSGENVDPSNATITAEAGDVVTITTAATDAEASAYQLVGAKVESATEQGIFKNSGIVRVVGNVDKVYFTFDGGAYTMDGEVADGQFVVNDVNGSGYYGVEIEDVVDVTALSVEAHVVSGEGELQVIEIQ